MKNDKFLIVGLGLIGGSYAQGLSKKGYYVEAIDINQESIDYAKKQKIIVDGKTTVSKEDLARFDVIIFGLYPTVLLNWIKKYKNDFKKGTVITDVTGIKRAVVSQIESLLPSDVYFIGAHPMAGREVYGVKNANAEIFKDANYIVTPTKNSNPYAVNVCKLIGEELEFKNVVELDVEKHDEMIAFLSQLTHCVAMSLMTCKDTTHLISYTGDSFRDLTRIANINENMWCELFLLNQDKLVEQMDLFIKDFMHLRDLIQAGDEEKIKEMMRLSTERRKLFNK